MTEDFGPLLATLQRLSPASRLEPAAEPELAAIRRRFPGVPEHYLVFLRQVGYGSLGGTFMVYSGLVEPDEIFDPSMVADLDGILFFGDTFGGTILGFDRRHGWRLVGVDHTLEVEPEEARTVGEFLTRWLAEQEDV